jgi:hypothetical protein
MENYILIIGLIAWEVSLRLLPTKVNFSMIDNFKEIALKVHALIDVIIPNVKKEE